MKMYIRRTQKEPQPNFYIVTQFQLDQTYLDSSFSVVRILLQETNNILDRTRDVPFVAFVEKHPTEVEKSGGTQQSLGRSAEASEGTVVGVTNVGVSEGQSLKSKFQIFKKCPCCL